MDDFTIIDENGQALEIVAFVDDDLFYVEPDLATFVVMVDEDGDNGLYRLERPTTH